MRTATLILLASVAMAYGFVQPTRRPYITTVGVPCDKKPRRGPPRCLAVPDPWPKGGLFSPPGFTDDLQTADELKGWSDEINEMMVKSSDPEGRPQFYNPLNIPKAQQEGASTAAIAWLAFPNFVKENTDNDLARWKAADHSRDAQDEYCEWSVTHEKATGKITKVTFTSEGPEYWMYLAKVKPDKVVELYQKYINPAVRKEDLFTGPNGEYNYKNRWNMDTTNGAMHLIQENNFLSAEVGLAAGASVIREKNGQVVTDQKELIECSRFGNASRNSDPSIGSQVNALARKGLRVTLIDPVGLYIDGLSTAGWRTPDGTPASKFWTIERGVEGFAVRAKYEVPPGKGYVVGDITFSGDRRIEYGSQIADFIKIRLTGLAIPAKLGPAEPRPCPPPEESGSAVGAMVNFLAEPGSDDDAPGPMRTTRRS